MDKSTEQCIIFIKNINKPKGITELKYNKIIIDKLTIIGILSFESKSFKSGEFFSLIGFTDWEKKIKYEKEVEKMIFFLI